MADEDRQSGDQEADGAADQPSLRDIVSKQRDQLVAKLGPEATLPDLTNLPGAPSPTEAPAEQTPAPVEQPAEAEAEAGDETAHEEERAAAMLNLKEAIEKQAAEEGVVFSETSAEEKPAGIGITVDQGPAPEAEGSGGGSPSLADIIAAQRAELKTRLRGDAPDAEAAPSGSPQPQPARASAAPAAALAVVPPAGSAQTPVGAKRRMSLIALFLGVNTVLIGVVTFAVLWFLPSAARTGVSVVDGAGGGGGPDSARAAMVPTMAPLPPQMGGRERIHAAMLFERGRYRSAARRYEQLLGQAAMRPADALARDLFAVRLGRCMMELGEPKAARKAIGKALRSQSPILRAYGYHMLAVLDYRDEAYMSSRRHAYAAIGVLGAMEGRHTLVADCEYLIARAMSAKVVSARTEKMDLPLKDLLCTDPILAAPNDLVLRKLLGDGTQMLTKAETDPSLGQLPEGRAGQRWMVWWDGPPVEQFLQKMGTACRKDVRWGATDQAMRRRAVTMVFGGGVSQQRLAEVACGMTGLMARFTGEEIVIVNPRFPESMEVQVDLLGPEVISMWRRFILDDRVNGRDDTRIAAAHYALGRVYESMRKQAEALRVYQQVSNNYEETRVAPLALLRSAAIRQSLLDYQGARRDLLRLIDLYPEAGLFGQAYLNLGIVTRQASKDPAGGKGQPGLLADAEAVFTRLYYLNVSLDTRKRACLELAECLYEQAKYAEAAKWTTVFLGHVEVGDTKGLCRGYLMLGKCSEANKDLDAAADAFYHVLGIGASGKQRVETLLLLVPVQIARKRYVGAIGALDRLGRETLDMAQKAEYLISLSESYRGMGLPDRASAILDRQKDSISDPVLLDRILLELARCQIQMGKYVSARKLMSGALKSMDTHSADRESIWQVQVELADVSLKLGETGSAIAAAEPVAAEKKCLPALRRRARQILGAAYVRRGMYDKAAEALTGGTAFQAVKDEHRLGGTAFQAVTNEHGLKGRATSETKGGKPNG